MRKLNKQGEKVKSQILDLLEDPLTASDIKQKMPGISSMGTILYHLNNLVEEGLLVREKQTKVRGQPTYYYLASLRKMGFKTWRELEDKIKKQNESSKVRLLKYLKDNPGNAFRLDEKFTSDKKNNEDFIFDLIFNENALIELSAKITPEGRKYLQG